MKILLHDCCAPCGAYVIDQLKKDGHQVSVYFYNPNIYPEDEFNLRLQEIERHCKRLGLEFIPGLYEHKEWLEAVKGYEKEPEKGKRCEICFQKRLAEVAQKASASVKTSSDKQENGFEGFATTLTISPHKPAEIINKIGQELADFYNLKFIDTVWRKNEGFKKSCEMSAEHDFHRQDYCGCEFSRGKMG